MRVCLTSKLPTVLIPTDIGDEGRSRPYHFTYNDYVKALEAQGLAVILVPSQSEAGLASALSQADALLIPGGDDLIQENKLPEEFFVRPEREKADRFLLNLALEAELPILGICYGMQLINDVLGGSHIRHMENAKEHQGGLSHGLKLSTKLKGWPESMWEQASYHHQCVDKLAGGLESIIESRDGVIEGYRSKNESFLMAFQWHVEKCETLADTFILGQFASCVKNGFEQRI